MRELREKPVRDLTVVECRQLLVHNHGGGLTDDRRRAYLFKSAENPSVYFDASERDEIEHWIKTEGDNQPTAPALFDDERRQFLADYLEANRRDVRSKQRPGHIVLSDLDLWLAFMHCRWDQQPPWTENDAREFCEHLSYLDLCDPDFDFTKLTASQASDGHHSQAAKFFANFPNLLIFQPHEGVFLNDALACIRSRIGEFRLHEIAHQFNEDVRHPETETDDTPEPFPQEPPPFPQEFVTDFLKQVCASNDLMMVRSHARELLHKIGNRPILTDEHSRLLTAARNVDKLFNNVACYFPLSQEALEALTEMKNAICAHSPVPKQSTDSPVR